MPASVKAAIGLFVVAEVVILTAVGWEALWLVVALGSRGARDRIRRTCRRSPARSRRGLRSLAPLCVLLTFEGGLFFLPAVGALLLAAVRQWRTGRHAVA